jgi:transcriptional regulator with XRE-family HTH domain
MKQSKKTVGSVIADFRITKKISQKKMAEDIGVTLDTLISIENGSKNIDSDLLEYIADYLNVPSSTIIYGTLSTKDANSKKAKKYLKISKPIVDQLAHFLLTGKPR